MHLYIMFTLFSEKRKSIPYFLIGKKPFQNCNPPDFKFYLDKLNNKKIPIWCKVNFESVFTAINSIKKQRKQTQN